MKETYVHIETGEVIEDELPEDMDWLEKQFYRRYIKLDLEQDEPHLYDPEWFLIGFLAPDILVFEFDIDDYSW
jgi:hypothetical protein